MTNSQDRFSDRVQAYIKYRPSYNDELIGFLADEIGYRPEWTVADIGSGTGILSQLFLRRNNDVIGVEPNEAMRSAAEDLLASYDQFKSVAAAAEDTGLDDQSVDLIVAGQAFHWFDVPKARVELQRILRPHGYVCLIWNDRKIDATPFLEDYEALLQSHGVDYKEVDHKNISEDTLLEFFGREGYDEADFPNSQDFDWDGLRGRALSSSYVPAPDHPTHEAFFEQLHGLFDRYATRGHVSFEYVMRVYFAQFS